MVSSSFFGQNWDFFVFRVMLRPNRTKYCCYTECPLNSTGLLSVLWLQVWQSSGFNLAYHCRFGGPYLCGHYHSLLGFFRGMYALQPSGFLELELADWKTGRLWVPSCSFYLTSTDAVRVNRTESTKVENMLSCWWDPSATVKSKGPWKEMELC